MEKEDWEQKALTDLRIMLTQKGYNPSWLRKAGPCWLLQDDLQHVYAFFVLREDGSDVGVANLVKGEAFKHRVPIILVSEGKDDLVFKQLFGTLSNESWQKFNFVAFPFLPVSASGAVYSRVYDDLNREYLDFKRFAHWLAKWLAIACGLLGVFFATHSYVCCGCFFHYLPYIAGGFLVSIVISLLPWYSMVKIGKDGVTLLRDEKQQNSK